MTKDEVKELVTPQFVRELFQDHIVESGQARWAITVCGKIVSVGGKIFYDSREQAVRGFYNAFRWRACSSLWRTTHPEDRWGWWRSTDNGTVWKGIKEALMEQYGFSVIQL